LRQALLAATHNFPTVEDPSVISNLLHRCLLANLSAKNTINNLGDVDIQEQPFRSSDSSTPSLSLCICICTTITAALAKRHKPLLTHLSYHIILALLQQPQPYAQPLPIHNATIGPCGQFASCLPLQHIINTSIK
jgi:hypothetical protein